MEDSKKVVEICTQYAQKGMINIFLAVFFSTLAFACLEPFFFIGYLISIAIFGLYQAIFMANAGGAWDNAKKLVETELKAKGTDAARGHAWSATPSATRSRTPRRVALNPVIKFTTLFGLLAVELARSRCRRQHQHHPGGGVLRRLDGLRLPVLLRDAHRDRARRSRRRRSRRRPRRRF